MQETNQNLLQNQKFKRNSPEYYQANKEKIRRQQQEYRLKNKERCNKLSNDWAKKNLDKRKEYRDKDLQNNPERVRARKSAYKRRLKNQMPRWADKTKILDFYINAQILGLTVDHILPLKGKFVSGLHVENNLQLMSRSDNSRKNNFVGDTN